MTGFAGLQPLLRAPLLATWNFADYPIYWPGFTEDPNESITGDPANPFSWVRFDTSIAGSEYGTFSGGDRRLVRGVIDAGLFTEPEAGDGPLWTMADLLEAAYTDVDTTKLVFHIAQAQATTSAFSDGNWIRTDWNLPFSFFKEQP